MHEIKIENLQEITKINFHNHTIILQRLLSDKNLPSYLILNFRYNDTIKNILESSQIIKIDEDLTSTSDKHDQSLVYIIPQSFYSTEKIVRICVDLLKKYGKEEKA